LQGVVALMVFANEGLLGGASGADLFTAIACILMGLGFTVHSFIPGMCNGWRAAFPFHALWHFFSAVTANRCGRVLDTLTKLVQEMERLPPSQRCATSRRFLGGA